MGSRPHRRILSFAGTVGQQAEAIRGTGAMREAGMADLQIDLDGLTELAAQLSVIRTQLDGAEKFSGTVASLVGDDRLADVVREFAEKWNLRRGFFIDDLAQIGAAAEAIRDTFVELDSQLGAGLAAGHTPGLSLIHI